MSLYMIQKTIKIVMGDPGRRNDPFGIVGIELDMDTHTIKPKLARQFTKTKYGVVADYILTVKKTIRPNIIGLETNNRGKRVLSIFATKYNLKLVGINTSANLTTKTLERGLAMDKPYMIGWLKEQLQNHIIKFPSKPTVEMQVLITQIHQIVGIRTPNGSTTYKAQRGRHDDLFMAFLLCCHMARLYIRRQEMLT